ncbi:MAG: Response regulator receiver protein [Parcubacteria group bacterium GW2011_GWA1_36_12]|nr:MAG: Response regulator receiver protein [Parcubacteria group bacterium GW2011_GWA1_36_12]
MKTYTTGQVAKICGLTPRKVANLFDNGKINGHLKESKFQRRSHRRIPVKDLIEFMLKHDISFEKLEDDPVAQKVILCHKSAELKELIARAKKFGDLFLKIKQSSDEIIEIIGVLGSLEDVRGIARNNSWAKVFRKMADVIEQHTRVCIANFKK